MNAGLVFALTAFPHASVFPLAVRFKGPQPVWHKAGRGANRPPERARAGGPPHAVQRPIYSARRRRRP
jgi:hypothetical protein